MLRNLLTPTMPGMNHNGTFHLSSTTIHLHLIGYHPSIPATHGDPPTCLRPKPPKKRSSSWWASPLSSPGAETRETRRSSRLHEPHGHFQVGEIYCVCFVIVGSILAQRFLGTTRPNMFDRLGQENTITVDNIDKVTSPGVTKGWC